MKVVFITPELKTFKSRAGGLGQVAEELVKALSEQGIEMHVISVLYPYKYDGSFSRIDYSDLNLEKILEFELMIDKIYKISVFKTEKYGAKFYFLFNEELAPAIYYGDLLKFAIFLGKASLILLRELKIQPDIIHLNDALTSLVAFYAKYDIMFFDFYTLKFVFTIHNAGAAYQQIHPINRIQEISSNNHDKLVYNGQINLLYTGLVCSDIVNTVSKDYASWLRAGGEGMKEIFLSKKVFGIVNGIDIDYWRAEEYKKVDNLNDLLKTKIEMKSKMIEKFKEITGKKLDLNELIVCAPRRIAHQKGFEEIMKIIPEACKKGIQFIFIGRAHPNDYTGQEIVRKFKEFHQNIKNFIFLETFDEELAKLLYAGSDLLIYPSLPNKEPCGTGYMMAMVNGTPTLGTKTGGMDEIIKDFDEVLEVGNGFLVWEEEYGSEAFLEKLIYINELYKNKKVWMKLIWNAFKSEELVDIRNCAKVYIEKIYKKL
ncbi:MAG: glycogen/starch synthase [Candidatus Aenigmatarchaeota archaeon]